MKFFTCKHCGNIIMFAKNVGVPVMCCGQKMDELVPGTSDGAAEKHVPIMHVDGLNVTVAVGSVPHPMIEKHFIQWVVLETKNGFQKFELTPEQPPVAQFALVPGDEVVAAYEFCNLHGLWKTETVTK